MDVMRNKREFIKCDECGNKVLFDEETVGELDGKIYCKKCIQAKREGVPQK